MTRYIVFFEKPDLLFDQAWEKFRESFTLIGRLLLKKEYQECEFHEIFLIPFDKPEEELYCKYVAGLDEFIETFSEKYHRIPELILKVKDDKIRKRDPTRQLLRLLNIDCLLMTIYLLIHKLYT